MHHILKSVSLAAGLACAALPAWAATQYPLTVENCGQKVTFTKAPENVVSIGQGMTEQDFSTLLLMQARASGLALAPEGVPVDDGL